MLSSKRKHTRAPGVLGPIARALVIAFTLSAAGCSADVTRFSFSGGNTTSSLPVPPEPIGNRYGPSSSPRGLGLTEAPLPPPSYAPDNNRIARQYDPPPPAPPVAEYDPPAQPRDTYRVIGRQYKSGPPAQPPVEPRLSAGRVPPQHQPSPETDGAGIEVQPGETLYSIGRRYGVSPAAIKDANGLSSDALRPGQRLVMPVAHRDRSPFARAPATERTPVASLTPLPAPEPQTADRMPASRQAPPHVTTAPPGDAPPGWEGRYTMRNGDSLYGIAQRHKVTLDELMRANGITDPRKVWAGAILNVPAPPDAIAAPTPPPATAPSAPHTPPRIINVVPQQVRVPDHKTTSRTDIANDAQPPAETTAGKFRWPVRGKVIANFGRRPDGTHNDGVNVAIPQGTDIHAAEGGKVAYAGNELKGYGNLILIRHHNGWVSAYAHADQILVKQNDEVRRGQVIAKSGRTGAVDQPQLHFELRQGSRPVDPVPHLTN